MKRNLIISFILLSLMVAFSAEATEKDIVTKLKEVIIDLQNQGELGFKNFTLCSNIIGFGQYVPLPSNRIKQGSEIFFYYEPVNLYTNRLADSYQIWFTQDIILMDEKGETIFGKENALTFNYNTKSPLMDIFSTNTLTLGDLPAGTYIYRAVMHDRLRNINAIFDYTFHVIP